MCKTLISYFSYLLLAFSLFACVPEPLDIELPQAEQKLVVYSQNLPDQALVISLSKSFSALTFPPQNTDLPGDDGALDQLLVRNARVIVNGSNYNDTLIYADNGLYVAPLFPFTPGETYFFSAYDSLTGLTVSSSATTLPIVNFDSASAKRRKGSDYLVDIYMKVNDPPGDNYYLINIYNDSIPDPQEGFNIPSYSDKNYFTLSDREYPEGQLILEESLNIFGSDTIVMSLTNISKNYFEYLVSKDRDESSFLSEPISFPTNVENGYGYFNLTFPSAQIVEIKE